mmetsp:Transcript_90994/g.262119  ORF Transcript_90994/g.262119 Transcript_90994/m.262119 type:complete len:238 (+) Transcript_90994:291-1004(+)
MFQCCMAHCSDTVQALGGVLAKPSRHNLASRSAGSGTSSPSCGTIPTMASKATLLSLFPDVVAAEAPESLLAELKLVMRRPFDGRTWVPTSFCGHEIVCTSWSTRSTTLVRRHSLESGHDTSLEPARCASGVARAPTSAGGSANAASMRGEKGKTKPIEESRRSPSTAAELETLDTCKLLQCDAADVSRRSCLPRSSIAVRNVRRLPAQHASVSCQYGGGGGDKGGGSCNMSRSSCT